MSSRSLPSVRDLITIVVTVLLTLSLTNLFSTAEAGAPGPTTRTVFVATGANFPDALGAAAAAGAMLSPVLLVEQNSVPPETAAELQRLSPDEIIIVGGPAVISDSVKSFLEGLAFAPAVTRLSGENRYATAVALSEAMFPTRGLYPLVAHSTADAEHIVDFIDTVVLSVSLTAPAAGTVVANSAIYSFLPNDASSIEVRCSITTGTTKDSNGGEQRWQASGATGGNFGQLAGTRAFDVAADEEITINLVCDAEGGDAKLYDRTLTAIFVADI